MDRVELENAIATGVMLGYKMACVDLGEIRPYLSKIEADRKYGRSVIDNWLKEGYIKTVKQGGINSKIRIKRMDLEIAEVLTSKLL